MEDLYETPGSWICSDPVLATAATCKQTSRWKTATSLSLSFYNSDFEIMKQILNQTTASTTERFKRKY